MWNNKTGIIIFGDFQLNVLLGRFFLFFLHPIGGIRK